LKNRFNVTPLLLVFSLLFTSFNSLLSDTTNAAGTESLFKSGDISYLPADSQLKRSFQSVFYKSKQINTKPFTLDAGSGKIITKIVLFMDGQDIKTIDVNARTYNRSLTLNGDGIAVKSVGNTPYGTWFAWQRSMAGTKWIPGSNAGQSLWGFRGETTTGIPEVFNGVQKDRWPGKKIWMDIPFTRNKEYKSVEGVDYGTFATTFIDASPDTLLAANHLRVNDNVSIDWETPIATPTGVENTTDTTTRLTGFRVPNLNTGSIKFEQDYDHEGSRVKLGGNGSAAMMYYFATYIFDIKSFTYRYPNKYEVYTMDGDDGGGSSEPGGSGQCTIAGIDSPSQVSAPQAAVMDLSLIHI